MKFGWRGALGLLVSGACLYFAFRGFEWSDARTLLSQANYGYLLLASIGATAMFPLRARRWRTILDPVAPKLPFAPLWRSTAIGMMVNNVIPARAGEVARGYALTREVPKISFSTALASLVVDRVFDAIVVLLLLAASTFAPGFPAAANSALGRFALFMVASVAVLLIGLYGMVFFPGFFIRTFELLARRVSPKIEARGRDALHAFAEGLSVLKKPAHFAAVFWWTLLHWIVQPIAFWFGFRAVGIDVPWSATFFVQGMIVLGVALPSTPGFVGVFEGAAVAALAPYGVNSTAATTWAVLYHVVSFIPITILGAIYFARLGLSMGEIAAATRGDRGDSDGAGGGPAPSRSSTGDEKSHSREIDRGTRRTTT